MKWPLLLASVVLLSTAAHAKPEPDLSDPELVNMYIWLDCEAMEYSKGVMLIELNKLSQRYIRCLSIQDTGALGNLWFGLHCVYTKQTWDFRNIHLMSLETAYDLVCIDEVEEYEIDF